MTRFRRPNTVETTFLVASVIWWPLFRLGNRIRRASEVVGRAQEIDDDVTCCGDYEEVTG